MLQRSAVALLACLAVLSLSTLAPRTRAEPPSPQLTASPSIPPIYLPALQKPESTPTATATMEPSPTPTISPTNGPTATAQPGGLCTLDPDPASAPNSPIRIAGVNEVEESVVLRIQDQVINLGGWTLCSINGDQRHRLPSVLLIPPGTSFLPFGNGAEIWDDILRDDAALYNPEGELVSYWIDAD